MVGPHGNYYLQGLSTSQRPANYMGVKGPSKGSNDLVHAKGITKGPGELFGKTGLFTEDPGIIWGLLPGALWVFISASDWNCPVPWWCNNVTPLCGNGAGFFFFQLERPVRKRAEWGTNAQPRQPNRRTLWFVQAFGYTPCAWFLYGFESNDPPPTADTDHPRVTQGGAVSLTNWEGRDGTVDDAVWDEYCSPTDSRMQTRACT